MPSEIFADFSEMTENFNITFCILFDVSTYVYEPYEI